MSKPGAKKTARQNRKRQQKHHQSLQQKAGQSSSFISPTFPGERLGAPTGAARWLGQKVASFLRPGKP